ncbi:hypothetical protein Ciccas_002386 [Cichlidogyrus casuarinus]|uniref:Uncharacterized protein n=1 Tax=Cichlidogyrus casuarinus TaxID=1844966 RepID=A0ABD2QHD2_9PLAT
MNNEAARKNNSSPPVNGQSESSSGENQEAVVVVLGSAMVGKSTLVNQLIQNQAMLQNRKYQPTVEEVYNKVFMVRNKKCMVRFVDTAASYSFPAMQRIWIHKATAFILMCSRDQMDSIGHLTKLVKDIEKEHGEQKAAQIPTVIVINKQDLSLHDWQFMDEEVEDALTCVTKNPIPIFGVSAMNNENTLNVMESLWLQNEAIDPNNESGVTKVNFEIIKPKVTVARRFSAFAVSNIGTGLFHQSSGSSGNQSGQESSALRSPRASMTPMNTAAQGKRMSLADHKAITDGKKQNVFFPQESAQLAQYDSSQPGNKDISEEIAQELEELRIGKMPNKRKWSFKKRFLSQRLTSTKKNQILNNGNRENIPIHYECTIS